MDASSFARLIDATPFVANASARDALFPNPAVNQRVHNVGTGFVERWDGSVWQQEQALFVSNVVHAAQHGMSASASAAQNIAALQTSLGLAVPGNGGIGVVKLPAGYINLDDGATTIVLPTSGLYSALMIEGEASAPVGAGDAATIRMGTVLKTSSVRTVIKTPTATPDTLPNWMQAVLIKDIQVFGPKTALSTFSGAEQLVPGLDISSCLFAQLHNVNVQGFGRGIRHQNCAEVYHTGLTVCTNNYIGVEIKRTGGTDADVSFANLQINENQRHDLLLDGARRVNIRGGECITNTATITGSPDGENPRIMLQNGGTDTQLFLHQFEAENHLASHHLIETDGTYFGTISAEQCCFQSLDRKRLIHSKALWFHQIRVVGCFFDHGYFSGNTDADVLVQVDTEGATTNDNLMSGQVIVEANVPDAYNFLVDVRRRTRNPQYTAMPRDYINVLFPVDNRMYPNSPHSRFDVFGSASVSTSDSIFGGSTPRWWWSSAAGSNQALIYPYKPLKANDFLVVVICDDVGGTVKPTLFEVGGIGIANVFWNRVALESYTPTGGRDPVRKYVFHVTVKDTGALSSSGITFVQIGNLAGTTSAAGLDAIALYARNEQLRQIDAFSLPAAASAPSGRYGVGEIVLQSAPTPGKGLGFICVTAGNPATFAPYGTVILTNTATWDPPSVAAAAQTTTTITVTGAALGDTVSVGFSLDLQGMQLTGYVSATNTVTVVLRNGTAGALDLASGTLRAIVHKGT